MHSHAERPPASGVALRRGSAPGGARWRAIRAGSIACEDFRAPAGHRVAPHAHEAVHFCFVLHGALAERHGADERTLRAGNGRASPAGDAHRLRVGADGLRCLILLVGDPVVAGSGVPPPADRRFLSGPRTARLAGRLAEEIRRADDVSPIELELLALELFAALARTRSERPAPAPPWLARTRERLRDDPRIAPKLTELAADVGVSRAHLARAFRGHYGCTVGAYLRALRVETARRLLRDSDLDLSRVAFEAGYADQSHMTRCVRDRLGLTPARYRAAVRDDAPARAAVRGDATPVQDAEPPARAP